MMTINFKTIILNNLVIYLNKIIKLDNKMIIKLIVLIKTFNNKYCK